MEDSTSTHDIGSPRYDPFRRSDGYGEIGTGPHSLLRKVLMYIRLALLGPPRIFCFATLLITIRIVCALVECVPSLRPWLLPVTASFVSRAMLMVLGFLNIQHKHITKDPDTPEAPTADKRSRQSLPIVVSNHVSWVDILLAGYLYRSLWWDWITVQQAARDKSQPPAGAQEGGFQSTADRIAERAREKWSNPTSKDTGPLVIFSEGTTTNGKYLLPFRTGAFVAGVPVQPVLLHYPAVHGRPSVAWETVLAPTHAILVLSTLLHSASVIELPLYFPSAEEQGNAQLFATNVQRFMALKLAQAEASASCCEAHRGANVHSFIQLKWAAKLGIDMQESSSGLPEKREYHALLMRKHGMK